MVPSGISKVMKTHSPRTLSVLVSLVLSHPTRWLLLAGVLIVFAISITTSPLYQPVPGPDSGVFLYVGQQILDGKMPYKDVWDHKPPAIHYINALGLLVGGGSRWGVWTLEFLALLSAACLGYIVMRRAFGRLPAIFGTAIWVSSLPFLLSGGNFAEEYSLPLQFGSLYLFQLSEKQERFGRFLLLAGVLTAACFLLKQNLIGIGVSIAITIAVTRAVAKEWENMLKRLGVFIVGTASVLAIAVLYFSIEGALGSLLSASFLYNFDMARNNRDVVDDLIRPLFQGLQNMSYSGAAVMALSGWVAGIAYVRLGDNAKARWDPILLASLVAAPIQFGLMIAGGRRPNDYYFVAWLPTFSILAAFLAYLLTNRSGTAYRAVGSLDKSSTGTLVTTALLIAMSVLPAMRLVGDLRFVGKLRPPNPTAAVVEYIRANTHPSDSILVWGSASGVNFLADRRSPTRFVYQFPVYWESPFGGLFEEFLDELNESKPLLVIDTSSTNINVPPIDPEEAEQWARLTKSLWPSPGMQRFHQYIHSNYRLLGTVGAEGWRVYRTIENETS